MSTDLRPARTFASFPETAGCAACGHPLEFTVNALSGVTDAHCRHCAEKEIRRKRREAYEQAALAYIADKYGLTVPEAIHRPSGELRVRQRKPAHKKGPYHVVCAKCGTACTFQRRPRLDPPMCRKCQGRGLGGPSSMIRTFRPKPCGVCGALFTPTGPNAKRCRACRKAK